MLEVTLTLFFFLFTMASHRKNILHHSLVLTQTWDFSDIQEAAVNSALLAFSILPKHTGRIMLVARHFAATRWDSAPSEEHHRDMVPYCEAFEIAFRRI